VHDPPPLRDPNFFTLNEASKECALHTKHGGLETTSQQLPLVEFEDKFFPKRGG